MSSILRFNSIEGAALPEAPLHLAIGMFDGVHLGHRAVIEPAVQAARRAGGAAAVLTFRPHPSVLFHPEAPTRLILDEEDQACLLGRMGVAALVVQPFTEAFSRIAAGDFAAWLKARVPQLAAIYVGQNFRFGAGRKGDSALLKASAEAVGVSLCIAPPVERDGSPVNSTRIRSLLREGKIPEANALLGYDYFARGRVVEGRKLGRKIGFPTLNLEWTPDLRPRLGVYAVRVRAASAEPGAGSPAVANYGLRPTVEAAAPRPILEIHVLGECPFGPGDELVAEWNRFIRPEMKFDSFDALSRQIAKDASDARGYFLTA